MAAGLEEALTGGTRGAERRAASVSARLEDLMKLFEERASTAETRLAKLEALLLNEDGLGTGSKISSSAMKDLQSKLDAVNAECLAEKDKNTKLIVENEKLKYRITHLIRAVKESDSR